jgi:hypothetical protein
MRRSLLDARDVSVRKVFTCVCSGVAAQQQLDRAAMRRGHQVAQCMVFPPRAPYAHTCGLQLAMDAAHQTCPYSKATRGNIDVAINVV